MGNAHAETELAEHRHDDEARRGPGEPTTVDVDVAAKRLEHTARIRTADERFGEDPRDDLRRGRGAGTARRRLDDGLAAQGRALHLCAARIVELEE
jgi:hypothetical protein